MGKTVSTWNISCGSRGHFCGFFFLELDNFPGYGASGLSALRPAGSKHRQHTPSPKRAEEKHVPPESNYIWWAPTSEMVHVTQSSQPSLTSHGLNAKMLFITVKITGWNFISWHLLFLLSFINTSVAWLYSLLLSVLWMVFCATLQLQLNFPFFLVIWQILSKN